MKLQFIGIDSWDRPVYEDTEGQLWKDTDPRADSEPRLCSACNNELDGEPDLPFNGEYEFAPKRAVWKMIRGSERWAFV